MPPRPSLAAGARCEDQPKYRYKLQETIAADISRGKLLILPRDIRDYGEDHMLDIARAVRMSMSIPFFFEPVQLAHGADQSYVVDGGVLSNFPVWLFDDGTPDPSWPTFGYKLVDPDEGRPHVITGPVTLLAALFSTMLEAHDARYIEDQQFVRTIPIPTLGVRTIDFDLPPERRDQLYASGEAAAKKFFSEWDFASYKAAFESSNRRRIGRARWPERARAWAGPPAPPCPRAGSAAPTDRAAR